MIDYSWEMVKTKNTELNNIPCRRGHTSIFTKERKMFVFGGIKGFNKFTNDLIEFDFQVRINYCYNTACKKINDSKGSEPDARAFHSMVMLKNNFFVIFGGVKQNGQTSNEMFVYNIAHNEYSLIRDDSCKMISYFSSNCLCSFIACYWEKVDRYVDEG